MSSTVRKSALPLAGVAVACAALGASVTVSPQLAFIAVFAFFGVVALTAPAGAWVLAALVVALTFRGLVQLHLLPSVATYLDLPLAWAALAIGLAKRGPKSPFLKRHLLLLGGLVVAILLAWLFHPSEALRPIVYLLLLGEPFAIVGALLADPPSPRLRRALELTLLTLVLIQIPLSALQLVTRGPADNVQGTLYGAGAGAHVMSAVVVVGAIWLIGADVGKRVLGSWRVPAVAVLLVIPFVADAKQVIAALPVMVLAWRWRGNRLMFALRAAIVIGSVVALFTIAPAGKTAGRFLGQTQGGQGGKETTAVFVWNTFKNDPASYAFGKGPAETVSRAAFMTTPGFERSGSPLASLGLKPATIPLQAESVALATSGDGTSLDTSLNSATSSALGVFGDLGFFGVAVYAALLLSLFLRLRRETSPEGVAAAGGFALFLVLGFVLDWWEQPPFAVVLGVLAGLALTARAPSTARDAGAPRAPTTGTREAPPVPLAQRA